MTNVVIKFEDDVIFEGVLDAVPREYEYIGLPMDGKVKAFKVYAVTHRPDLNNSTVIVKEI